MEGLVIFTSFCSGGDGGGGCGGGACMGVAGSRGARYSSGRGAGGDTGRLTGYGIVLWVGVGGTGRWAGGSIDGRLGCVTG